MLYAISANVTIWQDRSVPRQTSFHVQGLPTFYLDSDVQGIVSCDHAARIAVDMITSLGHSPDDVHVHAIVDADSADRRALDALVDRAVSAVHGPTADMITRDEGMTSVCERLEAACATTFDNPALRALRYHVSGAIARGEAEPITEIRPEA